MKIKQLVAGAVLAIAFSTAANAAPVSFSFLGYGFSPPGPLNQIVGSINIADLTAGIGNTNLSASMDFGYSGALFYNYDPSGSTGTLQIYSAPSAMQFPGATEGANNFYIQLGVTALGALLFDIPEGGMSYSSATGGVFEGNIAQTPLPAALPLLASGLGMLGAVTWRRKRKAQATAAAAAA